LATESPQRAYRAPCPGCGAPVEFRSAQSTHAVCAYCQSTVVRQGETLSRIGKMSELFDDFSPLQLMVSGQVDDLGFVLVGRLQYKYAQGVWTEWHALFNDGSSGYLSEDNGAYVLSRPVTPAGNIPEAAKFRVGARTQLQGKTYSVASNTEVFVLSAQGELPHLPALGAPFAMVELRSAEGEVLSVDYGPTLGDKPPALSLGHAVLLDDLALIGLRAESAKDEKGQSFNCPSCGAALQVKLASSKSLVCTTCHSVIDLSNGVGAALKHAVQDEPVAPLIALGSTGKMQGTSWQVVGFQHRMGHAPGDDEEFGWEEYLLYNRKRGFVFLVDSSEGWSLLKPATGAPQVAPDGPATYLGKRYGLKESYESQVEYVAGEFYWQVKRGETTRHREFAVGKSLLSEETTRDEVTWSVGQKLEASVVAKAFKMDEQGGAFKRGDVAPFSAKPGMGCGTILLILFIMFFVLPVFFTSCSQCDPNVENCSSSSSRTSSGSWGGSSGGGSHK
jgi:hypothetical protein